jgi:LSD1 subclass zinc finger protein
MTEIAQSFECPSCGASLQPPSGAATMTCAYCGTSVVVPENLRANSGTSPAGAAPTNLSFEQLIAEAVQMGQVVRLARSGNRANALQLYQENTGLDAAQAEKVIHAIASGNVPNPEMMRKEMAVVGEAIAAMRTTQEMDTRIRRSRRSGGIGCSGTIVLLIVVAAILVSIHNSTGIAHDLLNRLIAQLNLSGLIH